MKLLITGANGFIGKNLVVGLRNHNYMDIMEFDTKKDLSLLEHYCKEAEFVFHLAGINRPIEESEYKNGNVDFTRVLLDTLKKQHNTCPILFTSSIQATMDNLYGKTKKEAEEMLFSYVAETGATVLIYRLVNVFGKWCRPNYNSVVATFCHNIANGLPITINSPDSTLNLAYIDDVVEEFIHAIKGEANKAGEYYEIPCTHTITLKDLADTISTFYKLHETLGIPCMADDLTKKLYSTYLSYVPESSFQYELQRKEDYRGSFVEFLKQDSIGQFSVIRSKPGAVRGNHWHGTKTEKFLVVSGSGIIRLRKITSNEIIAYEVSSEKMEVVDIPVGYTHNIENNSTTDLVVLAWVNEIFDPNNPDTYYMEV